jgi:hypothetical protein
MLCQLVQQPVEDWNGQVVGHIDPDRIASLVGKTKGVFRPVPPLPKPSSGCPVAGAVNAYYDGVGPVVKKKLKIEPPDWLDIFRS